LLFSLGLVEPSPPSHVALQNEILFAVPAAAHTPHLRAMQRPADMDEPEWLHSRLFAPHIESFNFFLEQGLHLAVADMDAVSVQIPEGPRVTGMY
jgi:hypothetical protein